MKNIAFYKEKGTVYIRLSDVETLLNAAKKKYVNAQSELVHKMCEEGITDVRFGRQTIKGMSKMLDEFVGPIIKGINETVKEELSKNG